MKYDKDPVVEEIHDIRKQIFKKCNYDVKTLGDYILEYRTKRQKSKKKLVT